MHTEEGWCNKRGSSITIFRQKGAFYAPFCVRFDLTSIIIYGNITPLLKYS